MNAPLRPAFGTFLLMLVLSGCSGSPEAVDLASLQVRPLPPAVVFEKLDFASLQTPGTARPGRRFETTFEVHGFVERTDTQPYRLVAYASPPPEYDALTQRYLLEKGPTPVIAVFDLAASRPTLGAFESAVVTAKVEVAGTPEAPVLLVHDFISRGGARRETGPTRSRPGFY